MFKFSFAALLLLLGVCFSCKDHEVPEPEPEYVYAEFVTVPGIKERWNPTTQKDEVLCSIEFKSLGNVPIKEFGVALAEYEDPDTGSIYYTSTRNSFTGPAKIGVFTQWVPRPNVGWLNLYAAYVVFDNEHFEPNVSLFFGDVLKTF